jgi:hypothetical protein
MSKNKARSVWPMITNVMGRYPDSVYTKAVDAALMALSVADRYRSKLPGLLTGTDSKTCRMCSYLVPCAKHAGG